MVPVPWSRPSILQHHPTVPRPQSNPILLYCSSTPPHSSRIPFHGSPLPALRYSSRVPFRSSAASPHSTILHWVHLPVLSFSSPALLRSSRVRPSLKPVPSIPWLTHTVPGSILQHRGTFRITTSELHTFFYSLTLVTCHIPQLQGPISLLPRLIQQLPNPPWSCCRVPPRSSLASSQNSLAYPTAPCPRATRALEEKQFNHVFKIAKHENIRVCKWFYSFIV